MADIEGEVKYPAGFSMKDIVSWGSAGLVVHDEASQTVIKTPFWDDNEIRVIREREIYERLSQRGGHPRILRYYGTFEDGIRLEYVPNGNIRMFYHAHDQAEIIFERRLRWATQIAEGLGFLHSVGVVHGDLTSHNIFLDEGLDAKVADFAGSSLDGSELSLDFPNHHHSQCAGSGICSVSVISENYRIYEPSHLDTEGLDYELETMAPEQTRTRKPPRSWDALTPSLAQWVLDYLSSMGFEQPTPVQKSCLEIFRGNKDVVVEAVTGSGKTLAFLIPVVEKILRSEEPAKRHHVQAIVISPTRELASQIYNVLVSLIKFHPQSSELLQYSKGDEKRPATTEPVVVPQLLVGGTTKAAEDLSAFLRLSPNLLIGTPGRLAELLSSPYVKAPSSSFEVLVMDEADRLLDLGFSQELTRILGYLPKQRRTGLFSASLSEAVERLITVGLLYPHKITVRVKSLKDGGIIQERKTPMSLQMSYLVTPASHKIAALCQLLEKLEPRPSRSIVFFSTCYAVKYFARVLHGILPGFSTVSLHGKLEPQVREKNFERFVNATSPTVLLTTDIAACGLDIPQVDLVVQHDPPTDTKVFIHRCGRAGRAGRRGMAVVMLQPGREEGYVQLLDVRQTPITPLEKPAISVTDAEAEAISAKIRAQAQADREIFQLAQRAFVSWARSYIEHQATSIFRVSDLDWVGLAKGYGLVELPKMPEVKGIDRSLGLGIDTESIPFKDKVREKKRLAELEKWKQEKAARDAARANGDASSTKRKSNEAWSGKQEQEDTKVARREKKRRKREAQRLGQMTEKEREEQRKLEDLIEEVRKRNAAEGSTAAKAGGGDDDDFEGFDD